MSDEPGKKVSLDDLTDPVANALMTAWSRVKSAHCEPDRDREAVLFAAILDGFAPLLAEKDAEIERLRALWPTNGLDQEADVKTLVRNHREWTKRANEERDAARAELEAMRQPGRPRVWIHSDPEPSHDVEFRDRHGDVWSWSPGRELWFTPETIGCTWGYIAKKWQPLTEVVSDGD